MTLTPKLRNVEAFPIEHEGKKMIAVRDPLGIFQGAAMLPPEVFFLACLMNGNRDANQLQLEFSRQTGIGITPDTVQALISQLDQHFLLENPKFDQELQRQVDVFSGLPTRAAYHGNSVYPNDPAQAKLQIDTMLKHGSDREGKENPVALLAPHIDFFRGGECYGKTYSALSKLKKVERFVILGTSHGPTENLLCLTSKDYETPFGTATTDKEFLQKLSKRLPGRPFRDEYCHRAEHSVEFQIHFLKYLFPQTPVVPILCGSLQPRVNSKSPDEAREIQDSVGALKEVFSGSKNSVLIFGVDFAHVGPRFGNTPTLDKPFLEKIEREDRVSLEKISQLDARGFYHSVVDGGDPRSVCGLAPIYIGLGILENATGNLIDYRQCTSDDQSVTIAGMVFTKR